MPQRPIFFQEEEWGSYLRANTRPTAGIEPPFAPFRQASFRNAGAGDSEQTLHASDL